VHVLLVLLRLELLAREVGETAHARDGLEVTGGEEKPHDLNGGGLGVTLGCAKGIYKGWDDLITRWLEIGVPQLLY